MALGLGYGLPFVAQHGSNPYKTQWAAALEGAKAAGATVEDENAGVGSCLVSRGQEAYTAGLPATPSLLIVPQFYKAGNLYQDVPPFVAEDSTMRFAVTRDTTARRVNQAGLIESVASGVPRIDWLGQSCPALLVEASGQNLAINSADFTVSGTWSSGANTISANVTATLDPAGTNTADKIIPTAVSTTHFISNAQSIAFTSGTIYTVSIFAKAGGYDFLRIAFSTEVMPSSNRGASFNLTSGTVGDTQAGVTARIENYGNGWYRCSISRAATVSTTPLNPFFINSQNSDSATSVTFTGDGTSGAFLWGAQLEVGSVATTFIPTTTGSASRNADQIVASGALVSGLIGQTEGTVYIEMQADAAGSGVNAFYIGDGVSADDFIFLGKDGANVRGIVRSNNVSVVSLAQALTGNVIKTAFAYKGGDSALYVNGSLVASSSNAFTFSSSLPSIGLGRSSFLFDAPTAINRYRAAALYTTRLDNATLAQLTKL